MSTNLKVEGSMDEFASARTTSAFTDPTVDQW
jgi:hypothetical protein